MQMKTKLTALFILLSSVLLSAETIQFSADSMSGKAGSKKDITTLKGNAWIKTETMEIKADTIEMSGEDFRFINATGNVTGVNSESEMDFTCGKMKYDRNTKIANLQDKVHLIDKQNEVNADANLIEYNQNTDIAIMQISVKIIQKENTCTSAYAIYRKKNQTLEMSGNPKIVQGEDTFRAQEILLNLDTQEIILDGRVSGKVTDTKKTSKTDINTNNDSIDNVTETNEEAESIPPSNLQNTTEEDKNE